MWAPLLFTAISQNRAWIPHGPHFDLSSWSFPLTFQSIHGSTRTACLYKCPQQESGQTPGDSEGHGSLACCSPWGHKHWTWLSNWSTTSCNMSLVNSVYLVNIYLSKLSSEIFFSRKPSLAPYPQTGNNAFLCAVSVPCTALSSCPRHITIVSNSVFLLAFDFL